MLQITKWLADLVPLITTPISLVAFSVFVIVFLLTKLILGSGVIKPLAQKHGFVILNKVLNIAGLALMLIILLAFAAYIYTERLQATNRSKDIRVARHHLAKLRDAAAELKRSPGSTTATERLKELQPHIYAVGQVLDGGLAIEEIERQRELLGIAEITPALLAFSEYHLNSLLDSAFAYFPVEPVPEAIYQAGGGGASWALEDSAEDLIAREYVQLLEQRPSFPYKDLVYFLAAVHPDDWDDSYPASLVRDAALYIPIRRALARAQYAEAVQHADRFIREYAPKKHRHSDDALVLKVLAHEGLLNGKQALDLTLAEEQLPDGDMGWWLRRERTFLIESFLSREEVTQLLGDQRLRDAAPALRYTEAHHYIAEGKYDEGARILREILADRSSLCAPSKDEDETLYDRLSDVPRCVNISPLSRDVEKADKLRRARADRSPEGRFRYAVLVTGDELVHYNWLLGEGRSWRKERVPDRYFEQRNNWYIAAGIFKDLAAQKTDTSLRQRSLYKLGRCYQHLSYRPAFYRQRIGNRERQDYARLAVEAFSESHSVDPGSELADDALAEAGLNRWHLLGDLRGAERLLKQVAEEHRGKNAADDAVYWLAMLADERGDQATAARRWSELAAIVTSERLKRLLKERQAG